MIPEEVFPQSKKIKGLLRAAMNSGLGQLYYSQISSAGKPDELFVSGARKILTEIAGMDDGNASGIMGIFDEMIGWEAQKKTQRDADKKIPEKPVQPSKSFEEEIYTNALGSMRKNTLSGYEEALGLFGEIPGYKDSEKYADVCRRRIHDLQPPPAVPEPGRGSGRGNLPAWAALVLIAAAAVCYFLYTNYQYFLGF